jgi:Uma2 family endonuclease
MLHLEIVLTYARSAITQKIQKLSLGNVLENIDGELKYTSEPTDEPVAFNKDCHTEIEVALQVIQSFADGKTELEQPVLAAALTDALGAAGYIQPEMLIASNLGLVATVNKNTVVKAPDWFYVPQVHPLPEGLIRRSYSPNIDGANVVIVMEFLSEADGGELSIRSTPPYGKFHFYERILQVPTYITYDPYYRSLEVRYLQDGRYVLHPANDQGRVWIPQLELYLGIWSGGRLQQTMNWLRWWDNSGNLLLWSSEEAIQERQRADQEHQRAERLAAKLRELGIDPDLPD